MWASHSRVSLRQTPRYGVDETFSNVSPFRVYWNSRFFIISDWTPSGPSISRGWSTSLIDLPSPVTAVSPDLPDFLPGDTGDSHLQRDEPVTRPWKGGTRADSEELPSTTTFLVQFVRKVLNPIKSCSPNSVVVEFVWEALVGDNVKGLTKI